MTGAIGPAGHAGPIPQVPSLAVILHRALSHLGSHRLRWRLTLG